MMIYGLSDDDEEEMIYNLKIDVLKYITSTKTTKLVYPLICASCHIGRLLLLDSDDKETNLLLEEIFKIAKEFDKND
jgi:hypothetical protein